MTNKQLIECVPNFSEGRNNDIIQQIAHAIKSVKGVKLLHIDAGKAANRTVYTFIGEPQAVVQAAFLAIKKAAELIDMSLQKGEHPRIGATDVCPLIPIANITMTETIEWSKKLAVMVGDPLSIPVYLYEASATKPDRKNLATIRAGEYEGLSEKLKQEAWKPDFGPSKFNAKTGAIVIGARNFLIAYNINLDTKDVQKANAIAYEVREIGRKVVNTDGETIRQAGKCKAVKAIGWYIEEYNKAQVSMNLTDINITPLHIAFEACYESAEKHGVKVTGSELIGLTPKRVLIEAGKYFLKKQNKTIRISEEKIITEAVRILGLDELSPFNPQERVIEYLLKRKS